MLLVNWYGLCCKSSKITFIIAIFGLSAFRMESAYSLFTIYWQWTVTLFYTNHQWWKPKRNFVTEYKSKWNARNVCKNSLHCVGVLLMLVLVTNSVQTDFPNGSVVLVLFRHVQTKHSKPLLNQFLRKIWKRFHSLPIRMDCIAAFLMNVCFVLFCIESSNALKLNEY